MFYLCELPELSSKSIRYEFALFELNWKKNQIGNNKKYFIETFRVFQNPKLKYLMA